MKKNGLDKFIVLLVFLANVFCLALPVSAQGPEGIGDGILEYSSSDATSEVGSLSTIVNEYGKISLSMDAMGTKANAGIIHVEKPAGGKVRKAYLFSATTGYTQYQLAEGDVKINENSVSWEHSIPSSINSYNYWAEITNFIKPIIDPLPAGIISLPISERNTLLIDGEILAVIFEDPNTTVDSTVILYFGAQNIAGDDFTINTGKPIKTDDPNLKLDLSLGISYGYQGNVQYSEVDINGKRLTTSAGGSDDGETVNGALITVGGIGDTNANPSDPNALPSNPRSDDELYDLKPFVQNDDTTILIHTYNPSSDDNIFFAGLLLTNANAVNTIDVDISLHNNPTTTEGMAPYEEIIKYFADAVYESSNGINKLGTVNIYSDGSHSDTANIVWGELGGPCSEVAGFDMDGLHINMYDIFKDGSGPGVNYSYLADEQHQKMGGYTLGHEFGHLYYSIYDEYRCTQSKDICDKWNNSIWMPHSTDKPVTNSIMNSQWNASGDHFDWLNFSISKNATSETAQFRIYGASGWDTLARPVSEDPPTPDWTTKPTRLFHGELASVKPNGTDDARIDLPGSARSELNIIWVSHLLATPKRSSSNALSIPYTAQLNSIFGQNISYPDPILLQAFVHQDLNITDLSVSGSVQLPNGNVEPVTFADDGISPDVTAGDGFYSAIYNYESNGLYTFQVDFDNHALSGKSVASGFMMTTDIFGNSMPYPDPQPVLEDFSLTKTLLVSVGNVLVDDHENLPDKATELSNDNSPRTGRIDYSEDVDVFKITTLPREMTTIRVFNLGFGMQPHLVILDADQETVIYQLDFPAPIQPGYLYIKLKNVGYGATVYAMISDAQGMAGGIYQISAGSRLPLEAANSIIFLPMVEK